MVTLTQLRKVLMIFSMSSLINMSNGRSHVRECLSLGGMRSVKPRNEKSALFADRLVRKVRYNAAVNHCRTVQNRAFANYQYGLRIKLQDMRKDDKQF